MAHELHGPRAPHRGVRHPVTVRRGGFASARKAPCTGSSHRALPDPDPDEGLPELPRVRSAVGRTIDGELCRGTSPWPPTTERITMQRGSGAAVLACSGADRTPAQHA
ncbi:hypothetical protein NKG05_12005 [Oerskovia sp. M15]